MSQERKKNLTPSKRDPRRSYFYTVKRGLFRWKWPMLILTLFGPNLVTKSKLINYGRTDVRACSQAINPKRDNTAFYELGGLGVSGLRKRTSSDSNEIYRADRSQVHLRFLTPFVDAFAFLPFYLLLFRVWVQWSGYHIPIYEFPPPRSDPRSDHS